MRFKATLIIALALLGGCATRLPLESNVRLEVTKDTALPPPNRADLGALDRPSLLGPFDKLDITVFNVPELSAEDIQVDASGRLSLALIGTLDVSGKTSEELGVLITDRLRAQHVRDPKVAVNVKESVSQAVTVDGEVKEPGLYPVTNQMTLMRAIASAKGASEFARLDDVVILRTVDGQHMAGLYNLAAIRRGAYDDPPIYANDVVLVGNSPSRRLFRDVLTVAPLLVAPVVALIQRN